MNKLFCALFGALLAACAQNSSSNPASSSSPSGSAEAAAEGKVLARVNGVPITALDLELKLQNDSHEAVPSEERRKNVLEQLITKEVLAQKALLSALDKESKYQEGLKKLEAQVRAYKRQELAELLLKREGEKRSQLTDEDALAYFQKNEKRIRTQVHVLQILRRSEAAIVEVRSAIERGKSFDDAARDLFPNLPEGQRPWDLGYLSFYKVPEPWRETVYDMKPGEMSGILRGPNERFWLVKLVDVKEDEGLTFASVKDAILTDMKAGKVQKSRETLERELRAGAKIELVEQAAP